MARSIPPHRWQHTKRISEQARGNSHQRGYDRRWRKRRELFLQAHPLCAECWRRGRTEPATEVDHVIPHRGDRTLFEDDANLQALCKSCHSRKTARGE